MRKIEICRKIINFESRTPLTLIYSVTVDEWGDSPDGSALEYYGVSIAIGESGEESYVQRITFNIQKIYALIMLLSGNDVTPVTLCDIVDDWLAAN